MDSERDTGCGNEAWHEHARKSEARGSACDAPLTRNVVDADALERRKRCYGLAEQSRNRRRRKTSGSTGLETKRNGNVGPKRSDGMGSRIGTVHPRVGHENEPVNQTDESNGVRLEADRRMRASTLARDLGNAKTKPGEVDSRDSPGG